MCFFGGGITKSSTKQAGDVKDSENSSLKEISNLNTHGQVITDQ